MTTLQQTFPVTDGRVSIDLQLPAEFDSDKVEVTFRPVMSTSVEAARQRIVERLENWETSEFSAEKQAAYEQLLQFYRNEWQPRILPPIGLWDHFVWISDDFNEPMEDEDLWYQGFDKV